MSATTTPDFEFAYVDAADLDLPGDDPVPVLVVRITVRDDGGPDHALVRDAKGKAYGVLAGLLTPVYS